MSLFSREEEATILGGRVIIFSLLFGGGSQCFSLTERVKHLPVKSREIMYNTMIQPILDYGDIVWGDRFNQTQMDRFQVLQNKGC